MTDVCIFIIIFIEHVLFIMHGLILFGSMTECLPVHERIILSHFCFIFLFCLYVYCKKKKKDRNVTSCQDWYLVNSERKP